MKFSLFFLHLFLLKTVCITTCLADRRCEVVQRLCNENETEEDCFELECVDENETMEDESINKRGSSGFMRVGRRSPKMDSLSEDWQKRSVSGFMRIGKRSANDMPVTRRRRSFDPALLLEDLDNNIQPLSKRGSNMLMSSDDGQDTRVRRRIHSGFMRIGRK